MASVGLGAIDCVQVSEYAATSPAPSQRGLRRRSAHALWLYPVLGVAALASGSLGVAIANVPVALNGPAYDRYSFLVKPVIAGTLFGAFFALAVGFILGIA